MTLRCWMLALLLLAAPLAASAETGPPVEAFVFIPLAPDDLSFSQAAFEGYRVLHDEGYKIAYQANADRLAPTDMLARIDGEYAAGVRAFILVGSEMSAVATAGAAKHPDAFFATLAGTATGSNVINYCLDCLTPGGDLAGAIAPNLSRTKVLGFVGGVEAVDGGEAAAFKQSVEGADSKAKVLVGWTNDWSDAEAARRLTLEQIQAGADVIYATVSTAPIAVAADHPGVTVIGSLVDVSSLSTAVVASVVIRTDVIYRRFIASIQDGTFKGGVYEATTHDGIWAIVRR